MNLLRGTPSYESIVGMSTCEPNSWMILAAFVLFCIAINVYNIKQLNAERSLKEEAGILHESEKWMCSENLPFVIFMAFMSGFIGQIFGLGGAFMFSPMLLSIGVHPLVSASTCMFMMVYTTSVSMFMFFIYGNLNVQYTLFIAIWTGTGALLGLFVISQIMKRYKRPSLVAFALALAVIIATTFSIYSNIKSLRQQSAEGLDLMKGDPIC